MLVTAYRLNLFFFPRFYYVNFTYYLCKEKIGFHLYDTKNVALSFKEHLQKNGAMENCLIFILQYVVRLFSLSSVFESSLGTIPYTQCTTQVND